MKERNKDDTPEWLKKCIECTHCYKIKSDDEEIRCRCRNGCDFKKRKNSTSEF